MRLTVIFLIYCTVHSHLWLQAGMKNHLNGMFGHEFTSLEIKTCDVTFKIKVMIKYSRLPDLRKDKKTFVMEKYDFTINSRSKKQEHSKMGKRRKNKSNFKSRNLPSFSVVKYKKLFFSSKMYR